MAVLKFRLTAAALSSFLKPSYKEQPFSVVVSSKQSGPFQPCNLAAKLGEVAAFGTYLKFMVERPGDCDTAAKRTPILHSWYRENCAA